MKAAGFVDRAVSNALDDHTGDGNADERGQHSHCHTAPDSERGGDPARPDDQDSVANITA
jgi:hypothetical protein